ncbi:DEAD/DEAH box helicase [Candidatus Pacearchaeota archaeon]|nr:DEAD/DEAH box helicase [Candidatus Pacearchaeota archaeon]
MEFLEGITPRDYQKAIYETCVRKNCLVVLPTGLGKTLIALMLTIERMKQFPGEKVLFLAPTKPLCEQHMASFQKHLPELFGDMQLFTGSVNSKKRKEIFRTADIIFSTPQCIANDLKKEFYKLDEVCLLIEDEAHRCVKNYDYNYVAKRYKSQRDIDERIVGLTASPGSEKKKILDICRNLSCEAVEVRTRESDDVKEYLQELTFQKEEVDFPVQLLEVKKILEQIYYGYINELKTRRVLYGPVSKVALIRLQQRLMGSLKRGLKNFNEMLAVSACAQAIKVSHAIDLVETQTVYGVQLYMKKLFGEAAIRKSKGVIKLTKKPEFNLAYTMISEILARGEEHPKLIRLDEIIEEEQLMDENFKIIVFTQFRDTAEAIEKNLSKLEGVRPKVFVGQAKKNGKGLSQKEQKKIIEEFSSGEVNVLVATSIAEEGLDIPEVNSVVFYEPIASAIRSIQRRGRTARLSKGKLIMLITKDTKDEAYYFISRAREKKMGKVIDEIKNDFNGVKAIVGSIEDVQKTL